MLIFMLVFIITKSSATATLALVDRHVQGHSQSQISASEACMRRIPIKSSISQKHLSR